MRASAKSILAVTFVALMLSAGLPLDYVNAQLPTDCDVLPGASIQSAINAAPANARIRVCAGVFSERLTIGVDGLTLEGRPGAILDGTLLSGTRFAIQPLEGLRGFSLTGFEIRNYKNPLAGSNDSSSAIVSFSRTSSVSITNNNIHDNGYAGVFLAAGNNKDWTIANNTMANHPLAAIFASDAQKLTIRNNTIRSSNQGVVFLGVKQAVVDMNRMEGGAVQSSRAAVVVLPGLKNSQRSHMVTISNNTLTQSWKQGIWSAGATSLRVESNQLGGAAVTLGGDQAQIVTKRNTGGPTYQTRRIEDVLTTFDLGAITLTEGTYSHIQSASEHPICPLTQCLTNALWGLLDWIVPGAEAQAPDTSCAQTVTCDAGLVNALLQFAIDVALNPQSVTANANDYSRLANCQGQADSCLETAFFVRDGKSPTTWRVNVTDDGSIYLRFIDAGIRPEGQTAALHSNRSNLNKNWTTIVLCRLIIASSTLPCDESPAFFDFGLDITWIASTTPQESARWHLRPPSDVPHDAFDRIHSADATLFKLTTQPRDASSPAPPDAISPPAAQPPDSLKSVSAGTLDLVCQIVPLPTQVGPAASGQNDCPPLQLVTDDAQNLTLWCDQPLTSPVTTIHDNIVQEATTAWGWSSSCHPALGNASTTWTSLFEPQDLSDLASAQSLYLSATTDAQRTTAAAEAEGVYARVAAKHIAIGVRTYGMPLNWTNDASAFIPTNTAASIPAGPVGAYWDGSKIRAFVGQNGYSYDPSTGGMTSAGGMYLGAWGNTATFDGRDGYIFGGFQHSNPTDTGVASVDPPTDQIVRFNTAAGTGVIVGALPQGLAGAASFFDPRDLPGKGCPMGCAYVVGGLTVTKKNEATTSWTPSTTIYRYNPTTGEIGSAGSLGIDFARVWPAIAFDGQYAYIFGGGSNPSPWGATPTTTILRFDPASGTLTRLSQDLPLALQGAAAFWDGTAAYILGGANSAGQRTNQILKFTPTPPTVATLTNVLPQGMAFGAAAWTGSVAYLVGSSGSGKIVKVPTATTPDIAQRLLSTSNDFTASNLVAIPGQPSNIQFLSIEIRDANDTWTNATIPALVPMTSMRVKYHVTYTSLNGDDLSRNFTLVVNDRPSALDANVTIRYGNSTILDTSSVDPDNLDYRAAYQDQNRTIIHTLPLTNVTNTTTTLTTQLEHAAVTLPAGATNATVCSRDLWTARADGLSSNANVSRLAIAPAGTCRLVPDLSPILVHQGVPLAVTLEYRSGGAGWAANLSLVDSPAQHTAKLGQWNATTTLAQAATTYAPNPYDTAVEPTLARLTVEAPSTLTAVQQADALGLLIRDLQQSISIVAVEAEDLPLTPLLDQAIQNATQNDATVILAPAGRLPQGLWVADAPDKLMTITGLAASPLVLTVGSGGSNGVDSWSRLGPTPTLAPKPDFVAPSPRGTTAGSVANALPYVEALVARGVHDPSVIRLSLSSLATPTTSQSGAPATFWEQGYGTLDLSTFVNLTTTSDILNASQQQYGDADQATTIARISRALNTSTANVTSANASQLLGLAIRPTSLLRAAAAKTLLNLTIGAPAAPAQTLLDFGTVNYEKPGRALFSPVSVDTILNATAPNARELLISSGYSGADLDAATQAVQSAARASAEAGQNVTTNATFYNLFDLLNQGDYLYTTYTNLLEDQINNALPGTILNWAAINQTRNKTSPWGLTPYYFVNETNTTTRLPITVNATCSQIPSASTMSLANMVLQALTGEASLLAHDPNHLLAQAAVTSANSSIRRANDRMSFVYPHTQGTQLTCAADQLTLLESLRDNATRLKTFRLESSGNWTTNEATTGTWNSTTLGRQFGNATTLLGVAASTIGPNQALVLDAVLDAINRSIALLTQPVPSVAPPQFDSGQPTGTTELFTNADRTRVAPLGPYVGIARMTSHNVTTINPLTGRASTARNVTIPAPALLFNNPTLVWRETYRDSSPYAGALAKLTDGDGQVFNGTRTNYSRQANDGVVVDFSQNNTPTLTALLAQIQADQDQLRQLASASHPELGPYTPAFQRALVNANESLRNWTSNVNSQLARQRALDNGTAPADDPATAFEFNQLVSTLYSHQTFQSGILDQTGRVEWGTAFPGVYNLYSPYAYFTRVRQDTDYPYAAPGKGTLQGPMGDLDMSLAQLAHDALSGLPSHPTSPGDPDFGDTGPLSISVGGLSTFETQKHDENFAHINQFALELGGADLKSAGCTDLLQFNVLAQTNLAYPGCNALTLAPNNTANPRADITHDHAYAQCMLGQTHAPLSNDDEEACSGLHAALEQQKQDCRDANADPLRHALYQSQGTTDPCWKQFHAIEELENATLNLTANLAALVTQHSTVLVPWVRSPARVLCNSPSSLDFTVDSLLPRTRARNPGVSDATLRDDIASILAQCNTTAALGVHAVPPANRNNHDFILATSLMSHITDKVSGLDWTRFIGAIEQYSLTTAPKQDSVALATDLAYAVNSAVGSSSSTHKDSLLRVDAVGLPLGIDTRGGDPQDDPSDLSWASTVTVHTDPFLNYSRTHEMNTKYRGVKDLETIIVYFPSILVSASTAPVNEKFMLRNFSIQMDTYIGLNALDDLGTSASGALMTPLRFRENVEDYHLYFSVPDQLAPTTTSQTADLAATVSSSSYSFNVVRANLTRAADIYWAEPTDVMGNAHSPTPTMSAQSSCPDTAASGFWRSRAYPARGVTHERDVFATDLANDCITNTVKSNQAKHVTGPTHPMTEESDPKKGVNDGLAYNYNVANNEQQTVAVSACPAPALSSPNILASTANSIPGVILSATTAPDVTTIENTLNQTLSLGAQAVLTIAKNPLATRPSSRLFSNVPSTQPGYEPDGPKCDEILGSSFPVLHNFVVLNRTDAESLMQNVWNPESTVSVVDHTDPTREAFVETNLTTITPYGQSLGQARGPSKDPAISAVAFLQQAVAGAPVGSTFQAPTVQTLDVLNANGITGTGFALHATRSDTTTLTPQTDISPATTSTSSTFALTAYALGGAHTAGSNCAIVPAIALALRSYRCTGYEHAAGTLALSLTPATPCYASALSLFQAASAQAPAPATSQVFTTDDSNHAALERLIRSGSAPDLTESSFNTTAQTAVTANLDITNKAAILADCLQGTTPALIPPVYLGLLIEQAQANITKAIQAAQRIASTQNRSLPLQNVTAILQPTLVQTGEPLHLVDLSVNVQGVSLDGFTHQVGPTIVDYALQDWSTHLQSGNLTLTINTPTGTSVSTLATFTNDTSGLLVGSATITNVTSASTYTLVLKAIDDTSNVITKTKTFGTDIALPDLALTLSSGMTYTKLGSYSVHATAWDNQSGLRSVQVEMRPPSGDWSPVFSMDPSLTGTSGPIQFDQTLDLSLATTSQQYGFRFTITDRAGNVVTPTPSWLVVDKTPPDLTGVFTNALGTTAPYILSPTLSETVTASDPISGLATWRVWTYNTSSHTETTLNSSSLTGAFATQSDSATGWLGYTYTLNASATDVAGNTNTATFASVIVRGQPSVRLTLPGWLHQQSTPTMHIGGNVEILNFPGEKVDYIRFNYWPPGSSKVGPQFWNLTNKVGDFELWWNFTDANGNALPPGPYIIGATAVRGPQSDFVGSNINLTSAASGAFPLGEDTAIGVLAASSIATDSYTFTRTCGGTSFRVSVIDNSTYVGGSSQTLNFTLTQVAPNNGASIPTPPTAGTAPTATWAGAPAGTYQLNVTHTSSAYAPYEIHYSLCSQPASTGSPDPGPREPPTHDLAQLQLAGQT